MRRGGSLSFRTSIWLSRSVLYGLFLVAHCTVAAFDLLRATGSDRANVASAVAFRIVFVGSLFLLAWAGYAVFRRQVAQLRRAEFVCETVDGRPAFVAPLDAWYGFGDSWALNTWALALTLGWRAGEEPDPIGVWVRLGIATAILLVCFANPRFPRRRVVLFADKLRLSTLAATDDLPWDTVAGSFVASRSAITVCTTVPLDKRGAAWVQVRTWPLATDRDLLAAAIAHYVARPEERATIGTPEGHARLLAALHTGRTPATVPA